MRSLCSLLVLLSCWVASSALSMAEDSMTFTQPVVQVWPGVAPGSERKEGPETWNPSTDGYHRLTNIHSPSMLVFLPPAEKANGAALIVCPGGAHRYLMMDLEGLQVAEKFNAMGIAVFVLKYRLSQAPGSTYKVDEHSLADLQRAVRVVRSRAAEWKVKPDRIGAMGFSAGGEVVHLASTRFDKAVSQAGDAIDAVSARPDFVVQIYGGVRRDTQPIPANTPPIFLMVASDDGAATVLVEHYTRLRAANIPTEMHIYAKGGHGFSVTGRTPAFKDMPAAAWPEVLQVWLKSLGVTTL